jgi:hypothetical protein
MPAAIGFSIPGTPEIMVTNGQLPDIIFPLTIDGGTQPGCATYPCVVINGSALVGPDVDGLVVSGEGSEIRGLVINQFPTHAIDIEHDGITIAGNYIGTDVAGLQDLGTHNGIYVNGSNNTIGGSDPADRNVIAGYEAIGHPPRQRVLLAKRCDQQLCWCRGGRRNAAWRNSGYIRGR